MGFAKKEKVKIIYENTEETYRKFQPFKDVTELNANTAKIRKMYGGEMLPSYKAILDVLVRYSCKIPGVCYLTKKNIGILAGYSSKTVQRACSYFEELGFIVQYETKRAKGDKRQSSNAIVFVPISKDEEVLVTPNVLPDCPTLETPIHTPSKTLRDTDITDRSVSEKGDISRIQFQSADIYEKWIMNSTRLPVGWFDAAAPYAFDANDFYSLTGTLYKAKVHTTLRIEDHIDEFSEVLRESWYKFKKGLVKLENRMAYLYVAFKRTADRIEAQEALYLLRKESEAVLYTQDYHTQPLPNECTYHAFTTPAVDIDAYISAMF